MPNSSLAESFSRFVIEVHGDFVGHPFRGNQWKDGFGNEDKERIPPGDPRRDENFKKWFGKSVLVDEWTGEPLVLYHGTSDSFDEFDLDHPNRKDSGWLGTGAYLTNKPDLAGTYARIKRGAANPNVMPVYAKIEKPYYASYQDKARLGAVSAGVESGRLEPWAARDASDAWTRQLKAEGYDGVIWYSLDDDPGERVKFMEVVVFDPAGVKSATGNRGTFDPKDKRITHGDLPGHEFRGNQWTGGRGGGSPSVQKTSRYEGSPAKWDLSKVASHEELQAAAKSARAYSERVSKVHGIKVAIHDPANYINSAHAAIIEAQIHAGIMGASKLARDMMKSDGWEVRVNTSDSNTNDGSTLAETDPEKKTLTLGFDAVMQAEIGPSGGKAPTWGPSAQTWIENEPTLAFDKYGYPRVEQQILQHELGHVEVFALQRAAALKFVQDGDDKLLKTLDKTFHELSVALDDEAGATAYTERTRSDFTRWKTISSGARVELGGAAVQTFVPVFLNEAYAEMRAVVEANLWAHKETGLEDVDKYRPETLAVYAKIRSLLGEATKYLDKRPPSPKAKTYTDAAGPIMKSQVLGLPRSPSAKRGKHEPPTMGFVAPPQW